MKSTSLLFVSAAAVAALLACNQDDASVTARAQGEVNLAMKSPDSDVEVSVHDGRATLTGTASNLPARKRAEQAAAKVEGVSSVDDEVIIPAILTGATVAK